MFVVPPDSKNDSPNCLQNQQIAFILCPTTDPLSGPGHQLTFRPHPLSGPGHQLPFRLRTPEPHPESHCIFIPDPLVQAGNLRPSSPLHPTSWYVFPASLKQKINTCNLRLFLLSHPLRAKTRSRNQWETRKGAIIIFSTEYRKTF